VRTYAPSGETMGQDSGKDSVTGQAGSEPKMLWLDPPPPSRWGLAGGYTLLLLLVLACGSVASVIWDAMTDADVMEPPATSAGPPAASRPAYPHDPVTPSVGPTSAVPKQRSDDSDSRSGAARSPSKSAAGKVKLPPAEEGCTPGTAALSLCNPGTTDARP
jgi:hypothetical protein